MHYIFFGGFNATFIRLLKPLCPLFSVGRHLHPFYKNIGQTRAGFRVVRASSNSTANCSYVTVRSQHLPIPYLEPPTNGKCGLTRNASPFKNVRSKESALNAQRTQKYLEVALFRLKKFCQVCHISDPGGPICQKIYRLDKKGQTERVPNF